MDSLTVKSMCECSLNTLFEPDSAFFMETDPIIRDSVYNIHQIELCNRCGEWMEKVRAERL